MKLTITTKTLILCVLNGETKELLRQLYHRIHSVDASYILRRDLHIPFQSPPAKIPFKLRIANQKDKEALIKERPRRLPVMVEDIQTCFATATENDQVCYTQWLISSADLKKIEKYFQGIIPNLKHNEMLLEFAYTFKEYRGLGIMPAVMSRIAEKGLDLNARYIYTFVKVNNIAALKGCKRSGFNICAIRHEKWRYFRYSEVINRLPENTPYPFENKSLKKV
jgi:hypothetical protein